MNAGRIAIIVAVTMLLVMACEGASESRVTQLEAKVEELEKKVECMEKGGKYAEWLGRCRIAAPLPIPR
jgi:outer membrane murein-binding lipoprotein Lpp